MSVVGNGNNWECLKHGVFAERDAESTLSWSSFPECPACVALEENDICRECERVPATMDFSSDQMSYIHGFVQRICKLCYFKRVEAVYTDVKANYEKLKAELGL
jgi:hypothetical protein